jgi:hypothetical protein
LFISDRSSASKAEKDKAVKYLETYSRAVGRDARRNARVEMREVNAAIAESMAASADFNRGGAKNMYSTIHVINTCIQISETHHTRLIVIIIIIINNIIIRRGLLSGGKPRITRAYAEEHHNF